MGKTPKGEGNKRSFSVKLAPEVKVALERCAAHEDRTESNMVAFALKRYLVDAGYLDKGEVKK